MENRDKIKTREQLLKELEKTKKRIAEIGGFTEEEIVGKRFNTKKGEKKIIQVHNSIMKKVGTTW